MEKQDPESPKLTENDKKVLKKILDAKKISDSDIAKSLNLSPQAIFKIRNKLESVGIIKGYVPIIDYKKIGINVMLLLVVRVSSNIWENYTDDQFSEKILNVPYVVDCYRVTEENATHIILFAFRDTAQKEKYVSQIQTKYSDSIGIKSIYSFSVDKIITHGSLGILNEILDKNEFDPSDIFSPANKQNKNN